MTSWRRNAESAAPTAAAQPIWFQPGTFRKMPSPPTPSFFFFFLLSPFSPSLCVNNLTWRKDAPEVNQHSCASVTRQNRPCLTFIRLHQSVRVINQVFMSFGFCSACLSATLKCHHFNRATHFFVWALGYGWEGRLGGCWWATPT